MHTDTNTHTNTVCKTNKQFYSVRIHTINRHTISFIYYLYCENDFNLNNWSLLNVFNILGFCKVRRFKKTHTHICERSSVEWCWQFVFFLHVCNLISATIVNSSHNNSIAATVGYECECVYEPCFFSFLLIVCIFHFCLLHYFLSHIFFALYWNSQLFVTNRLNCYLYDIKLPYFAPLILCSTL